MFSEWREVRDTNVFTYNLEFEPLKFLTVFEYKCNSYIFVKVFIRIHCFLFFQRKQIYF